jgi:hypothetical protein
VKFLHSIERNRPLAISQLRAKSVARTVNQSSWVSAARKYSTTTFNRPFPIPEKPSGCFETSAKT